MAATVVKRAYGALVDVPSLPEDAELPRSVTDRQPENFVRHVLALGSTKTGDGLVDPKLVLSWLLGALGAPSAMIGLLVPVRESGALLPQLVLSGPVGRARRRRRVWAVGAFGQGLAVFGMAAVAWQLDGATAGACIVALLALFALSRAICSVGYKPLQGATLVRSTRGTATGTAGSIASTFVLAFGAALALGVIPLSTTTIAATLAVAGLLWCFAAFVILGLVETDRAGKDEGDDQGHLLEQLGLLRSNRTFARFVLVRSLLVATALAPPYLVTSGMGSESLGSLGPFVIASSLASVLSAFIWGRLADRSSRRVLIWSGWSAAVPLLTVAVIGELAPGRLESPWLLPAALFALMVSYQGVRLGRSTHLVDMAEDSERARFTAVSNTVIGVVLVLGGVAGWVADTAGRGVVLVAFAVMCCAAALVARGLDEVQS